ncbi:hypothetical protein AD998_08315 [bacterium 336/3]|nr:hypothetical protein AD998_08315 [bacterium 336/3]
MKDFFYGGVHKKTNNSTWLEEEEDIRQTEEFRKNFDNASYKEKRRTLLAKEEAKEKGIEFVTPKHSPYDKKHKVKRKENLSFITRKYFPYMQNDSEEFIAKRNEIASANHILYPTKIYIGQELLIPISEEEHQKTEKYYQDRLIQADKDKSHLKMEIPANTLKGADKEAQEGKLLAEKHHLSLNVINAGAYKEKDVKEMLLRNISKMLFISTHGNSIINKETGDEVQGISTKELTEKQENRKENDGYLSTDELNNLGVLNDIYLLFLNACATASKDINNQSTITKLFENNQVENVIGSYWNIDDDFTYQFAMAFIENLAKDKSMDVSKALRTTQLQAIRESKEAERLFNSHPKVIKAQKDKSNAQKAFDETPFISDEQWNTISNNKRQTKKNLEIIKKKVSDEIAKKGRFYRAGYQRPYFWAAYQHLSKKYNKKDYTLKQTIQDIDLNGVNAEQLQILQSKLESNEAIVDIRIPSEPDDKTQIYQAIIVTKKTYQKMDIGDKDEGVVLGNYIKSNKYNTFYNESYEKTWSKIDVILQKNKISKIYIIAQEDYKNISFNALFDYQNQVFLIEKYEIQSLF